MEVRLLTCVGATKAGTSWLYHALDGHPGCALRTVKELHYWDTFDARARAWQVATYHSRLADLRHQARRAEVEGPASRVASLRRRAGDLASLLAVLDGDRGDDGAYRRYLGKDADGRLAADVTPGYALVAPDLLQRMAQAGGPVLYIVRDPLARLWSHVRMQAKRTLRPGEAFEGKANAILARLLHEGAEDHIVARGDYPRAVERLRRAVPEGRLRVEYSERMLTPAGWDSIQAWLGIQPRPIDLAPRHEGARAAIRPDLRRRAATMLRAHYDWAARAVGPLPEAWQASLERATA